MLIKVLVMKLRFFAILIILALFISGCSDSPNYVAENWYNSMNTLDLETANEYSIECIKDNNYVIAAYLLRDNEFKEFFTSEMTSALKKEAVISEDGYSASIGDKIYLIKQDGEWKVINHFAWCCFYNSSSVADEEVSTAPTPLEIVPSVEDTETPANSADDTHSIDEDNIEKTATQEAQTEVDSIEQEVDPTPLESSSSAQESTPTTPITPKEEEDVIFDKVKQTTIDAIEEYSSTPTETK